MINSTVEFTEVWKASSSHPDDKVLIRHIVPLHFSPRVFILFFCRNNIFRNSLFVNVLKFVLDIGGPGDICLNYFNRSALVVFSIKLKCIVEPALGDKTTRCCWSIFIHHFFVIHVELLVIPQIFDLHYWVTRDQIVDGLVLAIKLRVISTFDISSVILVEIVKLIIYIDWASNIILELSKVNRTVLICLEFILTIYIVSFLFFEDIVTHQK